MLLDWNTSSNSASRPRRRIWLTGKRAATGNIWDPLSHVFSDDKSLGLTKAPERTRATPCANSLSVPIRLFGGGGGDQQGPPSTPAMDDGRGWQYDYKYIHLVPRPAAGEAAKRMPYLQSIITIVGAADLADMGAPLQTPRSFFRTSFKRSTGKTGCGSGGGHEPSETVTSQMRPLPGEKAGIGLPTS